MEDLARLREMQATYEAMRQRYQMLLQLQQLLADLPGQVMPSPDGRGVRIAIRDEREFEQLMIRRALVQSLMEAEAAEPKGPPPVTDADLARLATRTVNVSEGDCVVCMEDMDAGTVVCDLPCTHVFCRACVFGWLKQHRTCPVCRYEVDFTGPATGRRKVDPRVNRVPTNTMPRLPPEAGVDGPPPAPRHGPTAPVPARIPEELRRLPTPLAASQRQRESAARNERIAAVASNGDTVTLRDDSDDDNGAVFRNTSGAPRQVVRPSGGAARAVRQLREAQAPAPATEPPPPPQRQIFDTEDTVLPRPAPQPPAQQPRQPRPQPQPPEDRTTQQRRILRERREREAQAAPAGASPTAPRDRAVPRSRPSEVARSTDGPATNAQRTRSQDQSTDTVLSRSRQLPTASMRSGLAARRGSSTPASSSRRR